VDKAPVNPSLLIPLLAAPFIGSFIATLAVRLPEGRPVLWERSACDHCGVPLGPLELVPILSWAALGGRCRHCHGRIGWIHPVTEAAALLLALWAVLAMPAPLAPATAVFGWGLLAVALIDLRQFIIPNFLSIPLGVLGLLLMWLLDAPSLADHAIGALAGYVLLRAVGLAYQLLRGRAGLGEGDARLLAAIGSWVGWEGLPTAVLYASAAGLIHATMARLWGQEIRGTSRLPFGPHLCLGAWLVWLYGPLMLG
jgi:leader peptidase (prepilin peptidase)/N-methyltransferase